MQEHWSGLPFPSPMHESENWKWSAQSCPTPSDPMDCSLPGSSVHGIFQARVLKQISTDPSRTCSHWFFLIEVQSFCFCSITLSLTHLQLITFLMIFCVFYTPISSSKNFQTLQLLAGYNFHFLFETFMGYPVDDPSFRQIKIWSPPGYPTQVSKFILS